MNSVFYKITTSDAAFFSSTVKQIITNNAISGDETLNTIVDNFTRKVDLLSTSIKQLNAKSPLDKADEQRDFTFRGFIDAVEFCKYSNNPQEVENYKALTSIIDHYGGSSITYYNLANQTASSLAMFNELRKPDNIEKINLNATVKSMFIMAESANNAFIDALSDYTKAKAKNANTPAAYNQKRDVINYFNKFICNYLNIMTELKPEIYKRLHDALSDMVNNTNEQIKRHQTILKKEGNETEIDHS